MDWPQVTSLTIPEGSVKQIAVGDTVLWRAKKIQLQIDPYRYYRYIRKISDIEYKWTVAGDSYSIAIPCEENTTYTIVTTGENPYETKPNIILRIATTTQKIDKTVSEEIPLDIMYYGSPGTQSTVTFTTGAGAQTIIVQMGAQVFEKIMANGDFKCYEHVEKYTWLEYIESDGTQYIDTGYTFDNTTKAHFIFEKTGDNVGALASGRQTAFFGANNTNDERACILGWNGINYVRGVLGTYHPTQNVKTDVIVDYTEGDSSLIIDGVSYGTGNGTGTVNKKILLFAILGNTGPQTVPLTFNLQKIYTCELWNGQELVCNLVPARRNSDNKVGMYDTVRDIFLTNAGTGEFIAGYTLPPDYTQLEYIQNNGACWIDTGIMSSEDMIFETKLDFDVSNIGDNFFSSCRNDSGNTRYYLLNLNNQFTFVCSNSEWGNMAYVYKNQVTAPYEIQSHIEATKVTLKVNNVESIRNATLNKIPTKTLPLFAGKTNTIGTPEINTFTFPIKCYYARYIDNGVLVGDFIPCRRKSDGKVGMYDLITKDFKSSMTTNDFIAGEEVK